MSDKIRCGWCRGNALYEAYHDNEWGKPVHDDATLFEFILLEGFQAGLSWITILRRRESFAKAFDNFDYKKIARYSQDKLDALMQDEGIIRNRLKVSAAVTNAKAFMKVQEEFGSFSEYFWDFSGGKVVDNHPKTLSDIPATSALSDAISKDLKKRGFKFVGSTILYAHMQATGMVNDHVADCWTRG